MPPRTARRSDVWRVCAHTLTKIVNNHNVALDGVHSCEQQPSAVRRNVDPVRPHDERTNIERDATTGSRVGIVFDESAR